jgi:hypothetical protein
MLRILSVIAQPCKSTDVEMSLACELSGPIST